MRFITILHILALTALSSQTPTSRSIRRQDAAAEPSFPPCQRIANSVASSNSTRTTATLAYNCLVSMPFNATAGVSFIKGMKNHFQFQSTLAFAADPPPTSHGREPVDIMKGFDSISEAAANGEYNNHYEFEADIRILLRKLHDGHVSWRSNCLEGIFSFFHWLPIVALADSIDGIPKIYGDVPLRSRGTSLVLNVTEGYNISAISEIDGIPVNQYLSTLVGTADSHFHDPDARWNALFARRTNGRLVAGTFTQSVLYQGDNFTVTFENGTQRTIVWEALINTNFTNITSGEDLFYRNCLSDTYTDTPTNDTSEAMTTKVQNMTTTETPKTTTSVELPSVTTETLTSTIMVTGSATPTVAPTQVLGYPPALDVAIDSSISTYTLGEKIGVIVVHTYREEEDEEALMFQAFLTKSISSFKNMGIERVIIDVTGNSGGTLVLGFDMFKQFFPSIEPFAATNMRAHPALEVFYSVISEKIQTAANESEWDTYTSHPFSYFYKRDISGAYFPSWQQAYGPVESHGDTFTNLTRWDLVDQDAFGGDFNITNGDGIRNASYTTPWAAEDIVILGDGLCSSTCGIFIEMMKTAGVRTFVYGGRPQPGPMQMVGGVEGSLVLSFGDLILLSRLAIETHPEKADEWAKFLPETLDFVPYPPDYSRVTLNIKNTFRPSLFPDMDIPLDFIYDAASFRIQMTKRLFQDVTALWGEVANRVWKK